MIMIMERNIQLSTVEITKELGETITTLAQNEFGFENVLESPDGKIIARLMIADTAAIAPGITIIKIDIKKNNIWVRAVEANFKAGSYAPHRDGKPTIVRVTEYCETGAEELKKFFEQY